jgi:hypothetical protein
VSLQLVLHAPHLCVECAVHMHRLSKSVITGCDQQATTDAPYE